MTLSDRIRRVLRSNCNSIEEFAAVIGVSESSVHKWLSGEVNPRKDKLRIIAKKFGVTVEWLEYGIKMPGESDNLHSPDAVKDPDMEYRLCEACQEKKRLIELLEKRIDDKEEIIESLRDQLRLYKSKPNS